MIYFFVVRDRNGVYRAAANGCQVCFRTKRKASIRKATGWCATPAAIATRWRGIATEKGGCNPGPINPDLPVKGNLATIQLAELEQVT